MNTTARLSDSEIAELKTVAKDLRLHAKHADDLARADRDRGDSISERMWKLDAKALRCRAKEHDEAIRDERLSRRIDRSRAKLSGLPGSGHTAIDALGRNDAQTVPAGGRAPDSTIQHGF